MAKELLELTLYGLEEDGQPVPAASDPSDVQLDRPGSFVTPVSVYMPVVRAEMANQFVRKTVTLPKWLNDVAESAGINFSRSLQTAIRLKLDLHSLSAQVSYYSGYIPKGGADGNMSASTPTRRSPAPRIKGRSFRT